MTSQSIELRCVASREGHRCLGELQQTEQLLQCRTCGHNYKIVEDVPVLLPKYPPNAKANTFYSDYMHARKSHIEEFRTWAQGAGYCQEIAADVSRLLKDNAIVGPSVEIGAAGALFADLLPEYIALEYSLQSLLVGGFDKYRRVCASAEAVPFGSATVQFLLSVNTLEHVPDAAAAFREIDRVLRPGGIAYLRPAWNCVRYVNELLEVTPYASLIPQKKLTKFLIPLFKSVAYKVATRIPPRIVRRVFAKRPTHLRFTRLSPNYGPEILTDQDAAASLDPAEAILFFLSRGYTCLSHRTVVSQLTTGHRAVVVQKPFRN